MDHSPDHPPYNYQNQQFAPHHHGGHEYNDYDGPHHPQQQESMHYDEYEEHSPGGNYYPHHNNEQHDSSHQFFSPPRPHPPPQHYNSHPPDNYHNNNQHEVRPRREFSPIFSDGQPYRQHPPPVQHNQHDQHHQHSEPHSYPPQHPPPPHHSHDSNPYPPPQHGPPPDSHHYPQQHSPKDSYPKQFQHDPNPYQQHPPDSQHYPQKQHSDSIPFHQPPPALPPHQTHHDSAPRHFHHQEQFNENKHQQHSALYSENRGIKEEFPPQHQNQQPPHQLVPLLAFNQQHQQLPSMPLLPTPPQLQQPMYSPPPNHKQLLPPQQPPILSLPPPMHPQQPPPMIPPQQPPPMIPPQQLPPMIPPQQPSPMIQSQQPPPMIPQQQPHIIPSQQQPPPMIQSQQPLPMIQSQQPPPMIPPSMITPQQPPPMIQSQQPPPMIPSQQQPPPILSISQPPPILTLSQPPPIFSSQQQPPILSSSQPQPPIFSSSQPSPIFSSQQQPPIFSSAQPQPPIPSTQQQSHITALQQPPPIPPLQHLSLVLPQPPPILPQPQLPMMLPQQQQQQQQTTESLTLHLQTPAPTTTSTTPSEDIMPRSHKPQESISLPSQTEMVTTNQIIDTSQIQAYNRVSTTVNIVSYMSPEEAKYWKILQSKPDDFDSWVSLLTAVEKYETLIVVRECFDNFLKLYPYCFGYWRKYVDLLLKLEGWLQAQQVLETGVYSIPLSIDLWIHYANLALKQYSDYGTISALYDRSLEIAGYEYRSDNLWESAILYHESQNQTAKVFVLVRQLIATPTQHYKKHFHKYESMLSSNAIQTLLNAEEIESLAEQAKLTNPAIDIHKPTDEIVKEYLLDQGRQLHYVTEEEINLRQPFEDNIKRPYFHVQPLEESQLQTWIAYIDFEISRKYKDRTVFLFERCMIVCALYEELWIKYAMFLGVDYSQEARAVFQRAACHIPKGPQIYLEWALFEESLRENDKAREILEDINIKLPNLIETKSRLISFEMRRGSLDRVDEIYKQGVQQSLKQFQKPPSHSSNQRILHEVYNYWVIKYALFLSNHRNEHAVARKMIHDAIEKDKANGLLYFHLVDLEFNHHPLDKDKVMSALNKGIHAPIPVEPKEMLSLRKLHWAEHFGIPLDYKLLSELYSINARVGSKLHVPSISTMRKRQIDGDMDLYAKQPKIDSAFPQETDISGGYTQQATASQMQYSDTSYYQSTTSHTAAATGNQESINDQSLKKKQQIPTWQQPLQQY